MAKADQTPAQALQEAAEALHHLVEHSAAIAHAKKAFYDAYIAEGFTKEEALELVKNLSSL